MKNYIILFTGILLFTACKKIEVKTPDFDVRVTKLDYKVDEKVTFEFLGSADNITFYSGEKGFNYEDKDRTKADGISKLQFTSTRGGGAQDNSLKVLISTDLNTINQERLLAANWTDITSRAILSVGTTNTASGSIDLSEFKNGDDPIWLAFKYTGSKNSLAQRTWIIRSLLINNTLPDGRVSVISDINNAYWTAFDLKNPLASWVIPNTATITQISINGGVANSDDNEDWIVSKPLYLNKIVPDVGNSIKNLASVPLTNYEYVFKTAGVYKVTFVGFNNSVDSNKSVIKELIINVTP